MSRWLFMLACLAVLVGVGRADPPRLPEARDLGGPCEGLRGCRAGLICADVDDVLEGQCSATCNSDETCRQAFGPSSMCIGVDRCVLVCTVDQECPEGTFCNPYGWCERG